MQSQNLVDVYVCVMRRVIDCFRLMLIHGGAEIRLLLRRPRFLCGDRRQQPFRCSIVIMCLRLEPSTRFLSVSVVDELGKRRTDHYSPVGRTSSPLRQFIPQSIETVELTMLSSSGRLMTQLRQREESNPSTCTMIGRRSPTGILVYWHRFLSRLNTRDSNRTRSTRGTPRHRLHPSDIFLAWWCRPTHNQRGHSCHKTSDWPTASTRSPTVPQPPAVLPLSLSHTHRIRKHHGIEYKI